MRRMRCGAVLLSATVGLVAVGLATGRAAAADGDLDAQRWADAWVRSLNSHRLEAIVPLLAEGATYEDPVIGKPFSSANLAYYLSAQFASCPALKYEIERVTGGGGVVMIEWRALGIGGLAPLPGVFVIELDDNRVRRVRAYFDPRAVAPVFFSKSAPGMGRPLKGHP